MENKVLLYNKEEYKTYISELTEHKQKLEFNACDNLYSKLNQFYKEVIYYFDINYCLVINEALYYKDIKDYDKYLSELTKQLIKDIQIKKDSLKEVIVSRNEEKLTVNSYSSYLYNMTIVELLMNLYNKINSGYKEIQELLNRIETIKKDSLCDIYNEMKSIIDDLGVEEFIDDIFEPNVIKYDVYLKEKIKPETYEILEKFNCIEKLKLIKYPSLISVDLYDLVTFFSDSKIVKIIDGDNTIELNNEPPKNMFFIYFVNKEITVNEVYDMVKQLSTTYNITEEKIIAVYQGKEKIFAILTA